MAKSPWKLLTGLFRRGSEEDGVDKTGLSKTLGEIEAHDATIALPAPDRLADEEHAALVHTLDAPTADRPVAALPADEGLPAAKDEPATASKTNVFGGDKRGRAEGPRKKPKKPSRSDIAVHAPAPVEETNSDTLGSAPEALPEIDPVRALDDDIRKLRGELSAKLRAQNKQLKEMLKRFERH